MIDFQAFSDELQKIAGRNLFGRLAGKSRKATSAMKEQTFVPTDASGLLKWPKKGTSSSRGQTLVPTKGAKSSDFSQTFAPRSSS